MLKALLRFIEELIDVLNFNNTINWWAFTLPRAEAH